MKIKTSWIIFGAIGVLALWMILAFNGMVSAEEKVNQSFSDIQTQYQRRADLIPQLVATVDEAAQNEKDILSKVTQFRSGIANAKTPNDLEIMGREINSAINLMYEAYPQIRSTEGFMQLQSQLEGTENRIAKARTDYNEAVKNFNTRIKRFPGNMFNALFGFEEKKGFEAKEGADVPVDVRREFKKDEK